MTKIIYLSLLIILLIAPLTIAEVGFGEDSFGVHYASPDSPWFNNNTGSVNHSSSTNTWITSEGNLDDVSDIEHNWLTNLAWSVAGHTIDTTLGMNDNAITGVNQLQMTATGVILNAFGDDLIIADYLRPWLTDTYSIGSDPYRWTDLFLSGNISAEGGTHRLDVGANGNQTLTLDSGVNEYACIELREGGGFGFDICNDGAGSNRLVFSNGEYGTEWFWIDRDDGTINFLNSTVFTDVTMENITVTGDMNFTGLIYGNGSQLTGISGGNLSFNQTLTDTLYSEIKWGYNMSDGSYNATYDAKPDIDRFYNWTDGASATNDLTTTGLGTFGSLDVDTLNLNGNTISDSSGTINLDTWHTRIWDGDETTVFDINYDEDYSTTAIGVGAEAEERGIAIGDGSSAGEEGLSFGDSTETEGVSALALGGGAIAIGYKSIAIGGDAEANSDDDLENEGCIAIGEEAYAGNERAIAIGQSTSAGYTDSWAIGTNAGTTASGQGVLRARNIIFNPIPSSVDIVLTFMGSSNVGVFKWMEDEDYFEFEDDVVIGGNLSVSGDFSALNLPIEPSTATSQYVCWDTDGHIFLNETGC